MINLEIKVPAADLAAVRARALAAGARPVARLRQVDTFFAAPRGLLKLRVEERAGGPSRAELIAYERPETAGSRISEYAVAAVSDPAALEEVLERSLGIRSRVGKTRELLMLGGTRIHLDTVDGLGTFVELETEGNSRSAELTRAEHARVIEALGLDPETALPQPYAAMLPAG